MREYLKKMIDESITTEEEAIARIKDSILGFRVVPEKLRTAKVCLAAIQDSGYQLKYVPKEHKTKDLCLLAVQDHALALEYVPRKYKTAELCLLAIQNVGTALEYVPKKLKTLELCLIAVKKYWKALQFVPNEYKTIELCLIAVNKERWAIKYVPKELKNADPHFSGLNDKVKRGKISKRKRKNYDKEDRKYKALAEKIDSEGKALGFVQKTPEYFPEISEKWRTKEVCLVAITTYGMCCAHVPAQVQSEDFFVEAVRVNANGKTLKYIPEEFRTMKVCSEAVKLFPEALEYVPETLKTSELCFAAVQSNWTMLKHVPEELKTAELCRMAVQKSSETLKYMPEKLLTDELFLTVVQNGKEWDLLCIPEKSITVEICLIAVQNCGEALEYVPDEYKAEGPKAFEICLTAVKQNGLAIYYVPENLITAELCLAAVEQNGMALEYVPKELKTAELCLIAVQQNGMALDFVPRKIITAQLSHVAVTKNGMALEFVPVIYKTSDLCITAMKKDSNSFKFVPEKIKIAESIIGTWKNDCKKFHISKEDHSIINKRIILKPIFSSEDYGKDLIFINCALGYDGNINLLFADKKYDFKKKTKRKMVLHDSFYQVINAPKIMPETPQNYRLIIPQKNKIIKLNDKAINYTHGLQIDENKFCFAHYSLSDRFGSKISKNCYIFDENGNMLNEFYIGEGVKTIQTASKNQIWVSYNDVGSTSNKNDFFGCALVCIDDNGEVFHRYGLGMVECECFNLISEHDLVVNTYPAESPDWYAYAKISSGKVEKIIGCPTSARFIANHGNLILSVHSTSGSPQQEFLLVDIDKPDEKLTNFEFFSFNGEKLICVHAQKDTLYFWKDKMLYKVSIEELLEGRI